MTEFKKIYDNTFKHEHYAKHTNEEPRYQLVKNYLQNNDIESIVDISSGRGNVINIVKEYDKNIKILSTDLSKYHEFDVEFMEVNLCDESISKLDGKKFDLLSCLDVMEHVEKKCVNRILETFSKISKVTLMTIANHSDRGGIPGGPELHLIRENMEWWSPIIEKYFTITNQQVEFDGRLYVLELKSKIHE